MRWSLWGALAVSAATTSTSCNLLFPTAPDQICESQVRALCHFAFACCEATERAVFAAAVAQFRNEGECIQELLEEGGGNCANSVAVQEAIAQQRFQFDQALADSCIKPLVDAQNNCLAVALDPNALDELVPDACDDVVGVAFGTGLVKQGEPCFQAFECEVPDSICELDEENVAGDGEFTVTAVGLCNQPAQIDEDCSADADTPAGLCVDGSVCDAVDEECVALKDVGDDCAVDAECLTNFCNDVDPLLQPECDDLLADDEDCLDNGDCQSEQCLDVDEDGDFVCTAQDTLVIQACNGLQADDAAF